MTDNTGMTITARFSSICPVCRTEIAAGARVEWNRGERARHLACANPAAGTFQAAADAAPAPRWSFSDAVETPAEREARYVRYDNDDGSYDAWVAFQAAQPRPQIKIEDAGVYVMAVGAIVKV